MNYNLNDRRLCKEISPNIWLMNSHEWAYFAWASFNLGNKSIPNTLVHIDSHYDSVWDFKTDESIKKLKEATTLQEKYNLVEECSLIKHESFIAPAIIQGFFSNIHFYCTQNMSEPGLDRPYLKRYNAKQFIHPNIDNLVKSVTGKEIVFDLDIDIFTHNNTPWKEKEINEFLAKCSNIVKKSSVITIATSPTWCRGKANARKLLDFVIPTVLKYFNS